MADGAVSGPLVQVRPRWADDQPKPGWNGMLIRRSPELLVLRAGVAHPGEHGFVTLEPGDVFFERYWFHRWYNIFSIYDGEERFKGWYANISTPITFDGETIRYTDLDLDLWVWPDRRFVVLDEDEFAQRVEREMPSSVVERARGALVELLNDLVAEGMLFREPVL
jgi:protein associated with RNAse G/E